MTLYDSHHDIVTRVDRLERTLARRDWIEATAALVVITFFGICLRMEMYPATAKVGLGIIILGAIEATAVMYWARHVDPKPSVEKPFDDFCDAARTRVERQIRLLRNVNWWYTGPTMLGCCVFIYGLIASIEYLPWSTFLLFLAGFFFCLFAVGYIVSRMYTHAVKTQLIPIRNDIVELMRKLEDNSVTRSPS